MKFHGKDSKIIVCKHNTHIGDARATDMTSYGMGNIGQRLREQHSTDGVVTVASASYKESVLPVENGAISCEK